MIRHILMIITVIVELDSFPISPFRDTKFTPIGPGTDKGLYNINLVEGDIYVRDKNIDRSAETNDLPIEDVDVNSIEKLKNAVSDPNLLWADGAIIYKIDDDIGCPESPQCEILMKAMEHYHLKSCVRFKEWSGEPNYVQIFFNANNSGACWSSVGRLGEGEQLLSLGQRCWYFGIVVHELGHALGFWHEMNRPDRDDWIVIYWKNIIKGFDSAFMKHDSNSVTMMDEQFDYNSIMMYDEYAFSKDGRTPTLQARTGQEIGPIWRKKGLSSSDVRRLHKLYHCKGNAQHPEFPYDIICTFNNNSCGFKNGGSAVWNWRTVNETDGYMYSSWDIAGSTPGYLTSINFHPLSTLDKGRGPLGCARFWYLLHGDGLSFIKLSQIFLDHVTQISFDIEDLKDIWFNDTVDSEWVHIDVPLYVTRPFKLVIQSQFDDEASYGTIALDDFELLYMECSQAAVVETDLQPNSKPGNQTDPDTDFDPDLDVDLEEIVKPSVNKEDIIAEPLPNKEENASNNNNVLENKPSDVLNGTTSLTSNNTSEFHKVDEVMTTTPKPATGNVSNKNDSSTIEENQKLESTNSSMEINYIGSVENLVPLTTNITKDVGREPLLQNITQDVDQGYLIQNIEREANKKSLMQSVTRETGKEAPIVKSITREVETQQS